MPPPSPARWSASLPSLCEFAVYAVMKKRNCEKDARCRHRSTLRRFNQLECPGTKLPTHLSN